MIKEVVISDAHEGKSLARLTRLKWLVAAILFVALLIGWMARKPVQTTDVTETIELPRAGDTAATAAPPPGAGGTPASVETRPAALATPSLTLERRVDGQFTVRGQVADAALRDQWLNAIRIGAQGSRVEAALDVAAVAAGAPWEDRLRQLTALTADRRLTRIELEGERLVLQGPAVATSYRQDTERLFHAQLPDHFKVEYRTGNPPTTTARPVAAASAADGAPATARDGQGQQGPGGQGPASGSSAPAPVRQAKATPAAEPKTRPSTANCPPRLDGLAANIYFRSDSVALSKAERDRLTLLGRCMRNRRITVIGFADGRHNSEYNLDLSLRRAQAVANAIRSEAPEGASITTRAVGSEEAKGRRDARRSRRVEIRVR